MRIEFKEKGHMYLVNGEVAGISVTELLSKHGIAPNYDGVSKTKLKESANRGKEIHKDIENFCNNVDYVPKTKQGQDFALWTSDNVDCVASEQMLAFEWCGMTICGTADIMGYLKDGSLFIGDHKTTSTFHKEYVSWQVSILDYFARHLDGESVNGNNINWKGASKFYCFWYKNEEDMQVKELDKIDDIEIERLISCEYHNQKYQRQSLVVDEDLQLAVEQAEELLAEINVKQKEAELSAKILREALIKQMQKQNIKSWETDKVKVTYIPNQDRISVDSKKLKELYPMVYSECQKLTQVAPSVRVTIKGEEDDL